MLKTLAYFGKCWFSRDVSRSSLRFILSSWGSSFRHRIVAWHSFHLYSRWGLTTEKSNLFDAGGINIQKVRYHQVWRGTWVILHIEFTGRFVNNDSQFDEEEITPRPCIILWTVIIHDCLLVNTISAPLWYSQGIMSHTRGVRKSFPTLATGRAGADVARINVLVRTTASGAIAYYTPSLMIVQLAL